MAQDRTEALETIALASGARYDEIDWPVAIREALKNSRGGIQGVEDHEKVLIAIGVLIEMPHGVRLTKDARRQDGPYEVAVRALREIRELRGQQGAEAVRMAESALLAMGETSG